MWLTYLTCLGIIMIYIMYGNIEENDDGISTSR